MITPSADTARRWVRVAGLSGARVAVIPTGIDTNRFVPIADADRHEQRRAIGIDPGVPMILYAGRVDPTKGLTDLLEAVRRMEQRASLVVCGAGADAGFVGRLHRESTGMEVTWLDRQLDVTSLLAAADLVVLPSLASETQGMLVIEAMSCGTPAIASEVGGLPETLVAFPDHLVPPGDAIALAGALDRLVGWRQAFPVAGGRLTSVGCGASGPGPDRRGSVNSLSRTGAMRAPRRCVPALSLVNPVTRLTNHALSASQSHGAYIFEAQGSSPVAFHHVELVDALKERRALKER